MDRNNIPKLIKLGSSTTDLAQAQSVARSAWPPFPHNGCAANLSALLQLAGIDVPMTLGAGKLAHILNSRRGWVQIAVGEQTAGDIGVTFDDNAIPGADHIYLVVQTVGTDEMIVADNQDTRPHRRFASGHGRTPTEYFLRAV
ncbi:MAG: hypothetical protein JSS06_09395 [Proteobacteria bacterium]|nr:hypothetical protein [Pseudomonadota bacterium]